MKKETKKNKLRKYLWIFIFITNIIAIFLLLGATQAWHFLPSKAVVFSYLGMAFPILVVVNIMYLLFWIFTLKWQYAVAEIIALMACWAPMHTYMPLNMISEYVPEKSFKVMTYNVRHFNWLTGKDALANPIFDYILEQNADIVCFQEFGVARKKTEKGLITKAELDKKFKDYPYSDVVELGGHQSPILYGLAIYSKFPIVKSAKLPIWSTYNGCSFHELKIQGKQVTVVNTHLESNRIASDDKKLYKDFLKSDTDVNLKDVASSIKNKMSVAFSVREKQTELIKAHMDKLNTHATIVCGDFNDTPISYTYNTMKGDYIDSFVSTGRGLGITYHENMFWFRIDYILHSIRLKAYNTTVGEEKHSDHYPVWTNLIFK